MNNNWKARAPYRSSCLQNETLGFPMGYLESSWRGFSQTIPRIPPLSVFTGLEYRTPGPQL